MRPDSREQIMAVLKSKGPLVPNDLKKVIKGDTMIFGAILSELSSRGMVIISDMKKGGSPFYYLPGQEKQLENMVEFLNPKDQETVRFLKEQKVVMDKSLELFQRVSLRKIKDYSKELKVNTSDGELLFWRYYLVNENDALTFLRNKHNKPTETKAEPLMSSPQIQKEETKVESVLAKGEIKEIAVEQKQEEKEQPKVVEEKIVVKEIDNPNIRKPINNPAPVSGNKNQEISQQQLTTTPSLVRTPFYDLIWVFFEEQNINVKEESLISKDREYEFVVSVPSVIGTINYYVRARNKKKLNEGDVAPALLKAKQKDLQCLFLTNGEFSKKSLGLIHKEYSGLIIKTL